MYCPMKTEIRFALLFQAATYFFKSNTQRLVIKATLLFNPYLMQIKSIFQTRRREFLKSTVKMIIDCRIGTKDLGIVLRYPLFPSVLVSSVFFYFCFFSLPLFPSVLVSSLFFFFRLQFQRPFRNLNLLPLLFLELKQI